jgi:seryl-tRNA synthetase
VPNPSLRHQEVLTLDAAFLTSLFESSFLLPTGAQGVYGRGPAHEQAIAGLTRLIERQGFPPVLAAEDFRRSGYFKNFGPLAGGIHCFCGDEEDHRAAARLHQTGEDFSAHQRATGLFLTPAACYPVYGALASRKTLPPSGTIIDAASWCFRREPSTDPARQQMFRMHERVFAGGEDEAEIFRTGWLDRAQAIAEAIGLPNRIAIANDPFFGVTGRLMARSQRQQELKYEWQIPLTDPAQPTACASFNLHLTKMADAWNITLANGEPAFTACVGFGLDRLALAVFRHHGPDPAHWPEALA